MRIAMVLAGAALVLTGPAHAQEVRYREVREVRTTTQMVPVTNPKLLDLSRQVANGSDAMRQQLERGEPQSGKLGKRILNNLLNGGQENRDGRDPIYREFDLAAQDLVAAAKEMEHGAGGSDRSDRGDRNDRGDRGGRGGRGESRSNVDAERRFIRAFRGVERLSENVDRSLTAPTARGIYQNQISPALVAIRAELPSLVAFRDHEERREERQAIRDSNR